MHRQAIAIVLLSIAARILWSLDANPLLLVYDAYLTKTATSIAISSHDNRRIFNSGPTVFEGKTIWITGSSSGIGAELAIQLAYAGVGHLILSGRRDEKLELVAESCRKASELRANDIKGQGSATTRMSIVPFDISAGAEVLDQAVSTAIKVAAVSAATQNVGSSGIDILILNAGQYQCSPALDTNLDVALPDLMQVNFAAPVLLSNKLMQQDSWKGRGFGHIVTIASLMGRGASPLNAVYSASKHALRGYFHSLAAEEKSWLRVDVVLPGAVNTGLWSSASGSWNAKTTQEKSVDGTSNEGHSKTKLYADDRSKMSVQRCAQLVISSMMGPNYFFFESWITKNPGLLWVYLASYEPMTFQLATNIIAPLRVSMWRKNGEDALYLPTLLRHLCGCIANYFSGRSKSLFPDL